MRDFKIDVKFVDDSSPSDIYEPKFYPGSFCDTSEQVQGIYKSIISLPQLKHLNVPAHIVIAHEIGHVLGYEFNLPLHKASLSNPFSANLTLMREHEAWDIAEEMFRFRQLTIGNYERILQPRQILTYEENK